MATNGWKWLEMTEKGWNDWKQHKSAENYLK